MNLYEIRLEESIINNETLLDAFLFDCQCALFLVDMTNFDSFSPIQRIITNIDKEKYSTLKLIIVQNKSEERPETPNDELQKFIDADQNVDYITISLKTGENFDNLLFKIYKEINSDNSEKNQIAINRVTKCTLKDKSEIKCEGSFSLILVGDIDVGKTNLLSRYAKNVFQKLFLSTIGMNSESKFLRINEKNYKLTLWDTAGQERFRSLPRKYYRNINGILLLYDINEKNSFNNISKWIDEIKEHNQIESSDKVEKGKQEKKVIIYIIGNKIDLLEKAEEEIIKRDDKEKLAGKFGVKYYDVSCKWNLNIEEIMARMVLECLENNSLKNESTENNSFKNESIENNSFKNESIENNSFRNESSQITKVSNKKKKKNCC